ncbi:MAG TPA: aminotransferase class V-fold PLP-dependent enzyme [Vicinamibacterales bacterium]|nr:aminotransferase class V-fold PLP-dependent enzyme [Vicinamibacterales bacterium]
MSLLNRTRELAESFLAGLDRRPVFPATSFHQLVETLGGPLPLEPQDPLAVVEHLAKTADPGLVASAGPRYFGFVTGGSVPASVAAEWLTTAWDQNAGLYVLSPASAAIEHVAAGWLLDLLGLPKTASVGFVTGATMANTTALAAARHEVLRRAGWDVEADGLQGAPRVTVIAGREAHASIRNASRFIGLGAATIVYVEADDQGRMTPAALADALARTSGPTIVCAQSGNVNTGAFDPVDEIEPLAHARGAWLHVDGAFGLWAAASRALDHHVRGVAGADSWTVDGHKWLNVPYDSGFVIVAHPAAHRAAMSQTAEYLLRGEEEEREGQDWTPEASRRARGNAVYAALRSLGRRGIEEMIDRCCRCARVVADRLRPEPGVQILNDVVLNQILVRFRSPAGANITPQVIAAIQQDRTCWAGGTKWMGEPTLRLSVSGWKTTEADARQSADAIVRAHRRGSAQT